MLDVNSVLGVRNVNRVRAVLLHQTADVQYDHVRVIRGERRLMFDVGIGDPADAPAAVPAHAACNWLLPDPSAHNVLTCGPSLSADDVIHESCGLRDDVRPIMRMLEDFQELFLCNPFYAIGAPVARSVPTIT